MIRNVECKFYYITSSLDQVKIKNIKKFRDIGVIYKQENNKPVDILNCYNLKNICKKYHIPFFVCDDFKLANKLDANGVFLSSLYKKPVNNSILRKNFKILGAAHCQLEYFLRARQQCDTIVFSPLFYNEKYSLNKILSVVKFNLINFYLLLSSLESSSSFLFIFICFLFIENLMPSQFISGKFSRICL
jgi:thiamine-phosphate pyrophosphorylase